MTVSNGNVEVDLPATMKGSDTWSESSPAGSEEFFLPSQTAATPAAGNGTGTGTGVMLAVGGGSPASSEGTEIIDGGATSRRRRQRIHEDGSRNLRHSVPPDAGKASIGQSYASWQAKTVNHYRNRPCREWFTTFLPAMRWIPSYSWKRDFTKDLVAGLTVGVMVIPQSMSYAKLAGLPVEYGLYSALVPVYAYSLFGSSRQLAVGPVALMSLLLSTSLTHIIDPTGELSSHTDAHGKNGIESDPSLQARYNVLAIQAAFLVGIIYIGMGLLRLGFVTIFLSHAVVSGFTTGAAVIIGFSQLKYILGYDVERSDVLHEILHNIFAHIDQFNWRTFVMGTLSVLALVGMKSIGKKYPKLKWVRAVGPLTVTAFTILITWAGNLDEKGIPVVGTIPRGLPSFTANVWTPIPEIGQLMWSVVSMVIVGFMESIAIAKTLASKHKYELDSSLELIGLGMSNFFGAMFQSYPVTGSFSRSAVNNESGAVTGISGAVTATLVMLVLLFLTPIFQMLPLCVLASIVISGVLGLLDYTEAMYLWKVHRLDFGIWVIACLGTMFLGVELGLAIAVGLSILLVIYESAYPHTATLGRLPGTTVYRNVKQYPDAERYDGIVMVRIDAPIYFANTQNVRDKLAKYEKVARQQLQAPLVGGGAVSESAFSDEEQGRKGSTVAAATSVRDVRFVILELSPVSHVDTSALHILHDMLKDYESRNIQLCLCNPNTQVMERFRKCGFAEEVGYDHIFVNMHDAVDFCLAEMDAAEEAAEAAAAGSTGTSEEEGEMDGLVASSGSGAADAEEQI